MMARKATSEGLIGRLPSVRGRLAENASLGPLTWFRAGGPAEVLFRPADAEDLAQFIAGTPADVPTTVIGVGSNLLVRDGGIRGVVIRLGRGFAEVRRVGDALEAGAGALDVNVALTAQQQAIAGLEFLSGIPGTIGGALRMNAGAYGREMVDVTIAAEAVDDAGKLRRLTPAELGLTYRHSMVPDSWIFTKSVLKAEPGDPELILARIQDIRAQREATQPVRARTGGSTFANPPGAKAWELIDRAGCRGLRIGDAQVSEKHCNFLVNIGEATAAEIERLGEEVRQRVKNTSGIELRWEIRIIGEAA
ncbi:MAG: UDP-N-acetylmuramate dehydrogenase [Alphaproteobacteria bacterium]|nr:UDP-N-acetylmuramate dehydrogenase [Alphaproteobacteria bacterium]